MVVVVVVVVEMVVLLPDPLLEELEEEEEESESEVAEDASGMVSTAGAGRTRGWAGVSRGHRWCQLGGGELLREDSRSTYRGCHSLLGCLALGIQGLHGWHGGWHGNGGSRGSRHSRLLVGGCGVARIHRSSWSLINWGSGGCAGCATRGRGWLRLEQWDQLKPVN